MSERTRIRNCGCKLSVSYLKGGEESNLPTWTLSNICDEARYFSSLVLSHLKNSNAFAIMTEGSTNAKVIYELNLIRQSTTMLQP